MTRHIVVDNIERPDGSGVGSARHGRTIGAPSKASNFSSLDSTSASICFALESRRRQRRRTLESKFGDLVFRNTDESSMQPIIDDMKNKTGMSKGEQTSIDKADGTSEEIVQHGRDNLANDLEPWLRRLRSTTVNSVIVGEYCSVTGKLNRGNISYPSLSLGLDPSDSCVVDSKAVSLEPYPNLEAQLICYEHHATSGDENVNPKLQIASVRGSFNRMKRIHGRDVEITMINGDSVVGKFVDGKRHGVCRIDTSIEGQTVWNSSAHRRADDRIIRAAGLHVTIGDYVNGQLDGRVKFIFADGSWSEGPAKSGCMHGLTRFFDPAGRLTFACVYHSGRPKGLAWQLCKGGGYVVGRVDKQSGLLTGLRLAFLFPDLHTALHGHFEDGRLVSAQACHLKNVIDSYGMRIPIFTEPKGPVFDREEVRQFDTNASMKDLLTSVCRQPMLEDPYESRWVKCCPSNVDGAGEGMFTVRPVAPGTILAFYFGVRVEENKPTSDWSENAYKIYDPSKKGATMDVPVEFRSISKFRAALAHKTNHSFVANADIVEFDHPKWGLVPAIQATHFIEKNEEIFAHYGYSLDYCPLWYEQAWSSGRFPIPASMTEYARDADSTADENSNHEYS